MKRLTAKGNEREKGAYVRKNAESSRIRYETPVEKYLIAEIIRILLFFLSYKLRQ